MTQLVTVTLQRIFTRQTALASARAVCLAAMNTRDVRSGRPDFADTRPVVFRSEAFAEDLRVTHGVAA